MKNNTRIVLSGLFELIPYRIGSSISTINNILSKIHEKRFRVFLDQAAKGEAQLTQEIIEKEDFLHNYFATVNAVLRSGRIEKIRLFGNLFNSAVYSNIICNTEEYEFYLKILDELTYQEIEFLCFLDKYESSIPPEDNSRRARQSANLIQWKDFLKQFNEKFNIQYKDIDDYFIRIERTGCVYVPRIEVANARPYTVITTNTFQRLKKMILET